MSNKSETRAVNANGGLNIVNAGNVGGDLTQIVTVSTRKIISPYLPPDDELPGEKEVVRLLSWRTAIGPLVGRDREMDELRDWAASAVAVRARLISGPGGAGKSRLALELARELHAKNNWTAGFVDADMDADIDTGGRPLLVIIDYAEQFRSRVLEFLDRITALHTRSPLRLILLSRHSLEWWRRNIDTPPVHAILDSQDCEVSRLSDRDAVKCFHNVTTILSKHLKRDRPAIEPDAIINWINQDKQLNALPLLVTAAAIEAVLDPARALELSGESILGALAGRERIRIDLIGKASGVKVGWASRLTALGILSGGITAPIARALAESEQSLGLPPIDKIEDALRELPTWHDDRLQPVTPDLVGAKLLIDTLESDSYHAPAWLVAVIRQGGDEPGERLARLAYDLRVISNRTDNPFIEMLVKSVRETPGAADLIARSMGDLRPHDLLPVLLEASKNLADASRDETSTRVELLNRYSAQLAVAGEVDRALEVSDQAVRLADRIKERDPAFDLNILARSLHNRSNLMAHARRLAEAMSDIDRAVTIRRDLVVRDQSRYLSDLASSLQNFALRRSERGDSDGADKAIEEALDLYRGLWAEDPIKHTRERARAIHNYAIRLQETGNRRAAVAVCREAVLLRQELAKNSPARDEVDFTHSLQNLAYRLNDIGDYEGAIETVDKVLKIREQLIKARPAQIGIDLLYAYQALSGFQAEAGRSSEAIQSAERGVRRARALVARISGRFEQGLAFCLVALAWRRLETGDWVAAKTAADESVSLAEPLAKRDPARFEADLANCLHVQARCLRELGQVAKAIQILNRAVAIRRSLAADNPIRFGVDLSNSLRQMSWFYSSAGDWPNAYAIAREATEFCRGLATRLPARFDPELAVTLNELHWRCVETERTEEGLSAAIEAARLCEKYVELEPVRFQPLLASALRSQSERLADMGDFKQALTLCEEAMSIYGQLSAAVGTRRENERIDCAVTLVWRRLQSDDFAGAARIVDEAVTARRAMMPSPRYEEDLAQTLLRASDARRRLGQRTAAVRDAEEAVALRRRLAQTNSGRHAPGLCESLRGLSMSQVQAGRSKVALATIQECVQLRRSLWTADPSRFRLDLAREVWDLSARLRDARDLPKAFLAIEESVAHFRELWAICPERFSTDLGRALTVLSGQRADLNDLREAVKDAAAGLRHVKPAAKKYPLRHLSSLTFSFRNAAWLRVRAKQYKKALRTAQETVRLCRQAVEKSSLSQFTSEHAHTLNNLSDLCQSARDTAGALSFAREAENIWRDLARPAPDQFKPQLAFAMQTLARRLADSGNKAAALQAQAQALDEHRSLVPLAPAEFGPRVAENLLAMSSQVSDQYETLAAATEAANTFRLYSAESFSAESNLPWALYRMAHVLQKLGIVTRAAAALQEAIQIDERMLASDPIRRANLLVRNLLRLAEIFQDAGASYQATVAIARARSLSQQFPQYLSSAQIAEIDIFDHASPPHVQQWLRRASVTITSNWRSLVVFSVMARRKLHRVHISAL